MFERVAHERAWAKGMEGSSQGRAILVPRGLQTTVRSSSSCVTELLADGSEFDARFAIRSALVPGRTGVYRADTVVATNVPDTLDGGAILTCASGGATTARLELGIRVNALIVTGKAIGSLNGARVQVLRA